MSETPAEHKVAIFEALADFLEVEGYPPTIKELGAKVYLSTGSTHRYLDQLRAQGRVNWDDHKPRTLRITGQPPRSLNADLC